MTGDDELLFRLNELAADIGREAVLGTNVGRMRIAADRAASEVLAIRAALAASLGRCPTQCDDGCVTACHEDHDVPYRRQHDPATCPGTK